MFKSHVKSTIQKAQAGIAFIIFAALLSQAFNVVQYVYTRRKIQQQTVEKTYSDMVKMQNIVNLQTSVESAVHATMGDVRISLDDPDRFYGIVSRLVSNNDHIVGSAIAMRPGFYPDKDSLFAPFAFPENKDLRTTLPCGQSPISTKAAPNCSSALSACLFTIRTTLSSAF